MKKTIQLLLILVNIQLLTGQELTNTYGKIGPGEILYNSCEFDKKANAVVLFDKGESNFIENEKGSFNIVYERVTRIKILTDAGVKYGEIEIPFYYSSNIIEDVFEFEATSYNYENGELNKTSLDKKDCHDEKLNENWMLKKFAIPNVKKGSIIEYKYKVESPYMFNLRSWEFQWGIPVLNSLYVVRMIPFYQYTYILQGTNAFDLHTSEASNDERQYGPLKFRDMIHTFGMANIPAFNDEVFITSKDDYIRKISFQLSKINYPDGRTNDIMTTWPKLIEDVAKDEDFGRFVEKTRKMTPKILNPESFAGMNNKQKFDSVINYVKHNFTWDKRERRFSTKKPSDLLKDKFGSSADLNLFTTGLLNGVGIEAYPVLISTREHGKIKLDYPFLDFFDYTIIAAKIDSTYILSDATDIMLANNCIPANCINDKGLIVTKNKSTQWIMLQTRKPSKKQTSLFFNLNEEKNNATINVSATEYDGLLLRKKIGSNRKEILNILTEQGYQLQDSNIVIKNQTNYAAPYTMLWSFHYNPEIINSKIYLSPFLNEVIKDNPLKQKERTYPIDMIYPEYKTYVSSIKIPAGYKVDYLPANQKIKNDQFEMEYVTTVMNDMISISFYYYFKKSEYPASEYLTIKQYFDEIINKSAEKVILIKG